MDFDGPIDIFQSVSVIITPHDKWFTCCIIDPKPVEERDTCSIIAKGIVRFVTKNPDLIYDEGILAFTEEDKTKVSNGEEDNIIDLLTFKNKKDLH